jgi:tetratricopeptide (TPR) repeat protein
MGKVFWLGALGATEQQLHVLRQKEFVQRARRSSVEGEVEYAFKHVLVRDVAYGQIPRADRAQKHLRAGEWIESLGRPEDHAEMVAHHYVNALELTRAAGQDVAQLSGRACVALRDAGDKAMTLNALAQAEGYFRQALALVGDSDPQRPQFLLRYGRVRYLIDETGEAELEEARTGFLAGGDRETAADVTLMLADIAWKHGYRDVMIEELARARELVDGLSRSRAQVAVLTHVARYEMLADRLEAALEFGREALALAEELGLDDLRVHALNTVGVARADMGDPGGFDDLDESIALASQHTFVGDLLRGHNNRMALKILHGDFEAARASEKTTLELSAHFGVRGSARFIEAGAAVAHRYMVGEWDDALARAEAVIAEAEQGGRFYQVGGVYGLRGLIRLARGDAEGAEADAERSVVLSRSIKDPQALHPNLSVDAGIFMSTGNVERAGETLSESVAGLRDLHPLGFAVIELPMLGWVAATLGRESELVEAVEYEAFKSPWLRATLAAASRDFRSTADIFRGMGLTVYEAFFRLQTGAERDVRIALEFYRRVGATWYMREGESQLAALA